MLAKLGIVIALLLLSANILFAADIKLNQVVSTSLPNSIIDSSIDMHMVFVKGGCYSMGDAYGDGEPNEKPVHEACVDDFYIGKYEMTQGQWKKIMKNNPSWINDRGGPGTCGDDCPIVNVSWNQVQEFIIKLNTMSGEGKYRLPTEAEWEYAARSGGKSQKYSGGNDIFSFSWYNENSPDVLHVIGKKAPNGLGLFDMSGNVWEWVNDWYESDYYSTSPRNNPMGPATGVNRVKRGGCQNGTYSNSRVSRRNSDPPDMVDQPYLGFRLMRTP